MPHTPQQVSPRGIHKNATFKQAAPPLRATLRAFPAGLEAVRPLPSRGPAGLPDLTPGTFPGVPSHEDKDECLSLMSRLVCGILLQPPERTRTALPLAIPPHE